MTDKCPCSSDICLGKHISLVICVWGGETHITTTLAVSTVLAVPMPPWKQCSKFLEH